MASSEQSTWPAHVKLEMTQDNERLMLIGSGPAYSLETSEYVGGTTDSVLIEEDVFI